MSKTSITDLSKEGVYPKREKPVDIQKYSETLFRNNDLQLSLDSQLADLVGACSEHLQDGEFSRFLKAQKRFDAPVNFFQGWDKPGKRVEHYHLKLSLKELPEYMKAAEEAGLTYEQAIDLLVHTLDSDPYADTLKHDSTYIKLLGRLFRRAAHLKINLSENFDEMRKLVKLAAEEGVLEPSLYGLTNAIRSGIATSDAIKMIMKLPEADGALSGYAFPHFNDALKSMVPAKVDTELAAEVFEVLGGKRPYFQSGSYGAFKELMTFGCPSKGMTPNELLALFLAKKKKGVPMLEEGTDTDPNKEQEKIVPKEKYFIENDSKELEHAAQPYRMVRELNEGIRDLEKLAVANAHRWEEVGEGMWTFDPKEKTWYSFGGQLETPSMGDVLSGKAEGVRHNFLPYDVSTLSETPLLFHVHPEFYDVFIAPKKETMSHPELTDDITKFLTATPSGADFGTVAELLKGSQKQVPTRAFIAHALGTTEFTYPNDVAKLEEMKDKFRSLRDQVLLNFDVEGYLQKYGFPVNRLHLVQSLIADLNGRLPKGFSLRLYPAGTDFEQSTKLPDLQKNIGTRIKGHLRKFLR